VAALLDYSGSIPMLHAMFLLPFSGIRHVRFSLEPHHPTILHHQTDMPLIVLSLSNSVMSSIACL